MNVRTPTINHVTLAGNLTRDAKIDHVGDDLITVARLSVANNGHYRDKSGNWHDLVTYVDAEIWGAAAERVESFGKKGAPVVVEGTLKQNIWTDKEGNKHSKVLIKADRIHHLLK
ncbi:MAG: single-stranded DNA-binding protein [Candidatus Cloacimonadales bacterium]